MRSWLFLHVLLVQEAKSELGNLTQKTFSEGSNPARLCSLESCGASTFKKSKICILIFRGRRGTGEKKGNGKKHFPSSVVADFQSRCCHSCTNGCPHFDCVQAGNCNFKMHQCFSPTGSLTHEVQKRREGGFKFSKPSVVQCSRSTSLPAGHDHAVIGVLAMNSAEKGDSASENLQLNSHF